MCHFARNPLGSAGSRDELWRPDSVHDILQSPRIIRRVIPYVVMSVSVHYTAKSWGGARLGLVLSYVMCLITPSKASMNRHAILGKESNYCSEHLVSSNVGRR